MAFYRDSWDSDYEKCDEWSHEYGCLCKKRKDCPHSKITDDDEDSWDQSYYDSCWKSNYKISFFDEPDGSNLHQHQTIRKTRPKLIITNDSKPPNCELDDKKIMASSEQELEECSSQALLKDLGVLHLDPKFADVKLQVGGKEFASHKAILSARSPVFAAMFQSDMLESKENKVEIKEMKPEVMKEMLEFIYTGRASNLDTFAQDLLVAADRYDLATLRVLAEGNLVRKLSITNATDLLMLGDDCSADKLMKETAKFIAKNLRKIVDKKESNWNQMVEEKPKLMNLILKFLVAEPAQSHFKVSDIFEV